MSHSQHDRTRLLELLTTLSFAKRDITLASGQKASWYIDCKQTALTGEGHVLIGRLFLSELERIEQAQDSVGKHTAVSGMSIGADPLCSSLALTAFQNGRSLNAIFVRKEAKGHGTAAFLEGTRSVADAAHIIMVEDVVTTGGSTLKAAQRVRDGGYKVDHVLALVDRQAGGAENLQQAGLTLHALYGPSDFGVS